MDMRWLAVAPVSLALGWGGCEWYAGHRVMASWQQQQAFFTENFPRITVSEQHVRPGLAGLTVETTFDLVSDPCKQKTIRVMLREKITPTLLFSAGTVRSTIDVVFPGTDDPEMEKLFHGRKPLVITGEYQPKERTLYHLSSPAMQGNPEAGWTVSWRGLDADVTLEPALSEMKLASRGVDIAKDSGGSFSLDDLTLTTRSRQGEGGLTLGEHEARIGEVGFSLDGSKHLTLSDATFRSKMDGKGGLVGWNLAYNIGDIRMGELFSANGEADISLNHLRAASLRKVLDAVRKENSACKPDPRPAMNAMKELLAGNAELLVNKLDVNWGENTLHLDGHIKGLTAAVKADKDTSAMAEAAKQLDAQLTLSANESFLNRFSHLPAASLVGGGAMAQVQTLPYQEFMTRQGENYMLVLALKDGELTLNGQPWNEVVSNYRLSHPQTDSMPAVTDAPAGLRPASPYGY